MSLLNLTDPEANQVSAPPVDFAPKDVFDVTEATYRSSNIFRFMDNIDSRIHDEVTKLNNVYREATGRNLSEKLDRRLENPFGSRGQMKREYEELTQEQIQLLDNEIIGLRQKNPGRYSGFETVSEIRDRVKKQLQKEAEETDREMALAVAGNDNGASVAAGVVMGALGAGFTDPVNLIATFGLGGAAGRFVKTGASAIKNISRIMLTEAGINAAVEVGQHDAISRWHEELGREYGLGDLGLNVAMAGIGAAVLSGGSVAALRGLSRSGFDGMITRLELSADGAALSRMSDPAVLDFVEQMAANPQGITRRMLDAEISPVTRSLITDVHRQIKTVDNLGIDSSKLELAEAVTRKYLKNEVINEREMLELASSAFDRALDLPDSKARKVLKELSKFFQDEVGAISDLKLNKTATGFLRKLRKAKPDQLSVIERESARRLKVLDGDRIDQRAIDRELARRQKLQRLGIRSKKSGLDPKGKEASLETDLATAVRARRITRLKDTKPKHKITRLGSKQEDFNDIFRMMERLVDSDIQNRNIEAVAQQYKESVERAAALGVGFKEEVGEDLKAITGTDFENAKIFVDGQERKVSQILEDFDQDDRVLAAAQACASEVGGGSVQ